MADTRWHAWQLRSGVVVGAILALLATQGCAARSEMTEVWHDPTLASGSLRDVLVVGIRKTPVRRRAWEDAFTTALQERGVTATSSYRLYPEAAPDTLQMIAAVRKHGYDAVLLSVRLPDEITSQYVPGALRQEPVSSRDYYGRFHSYWVTVQDPGYTETDVIVRIQTDVWATTPPGGRLVWSGTLHTLESVDHRTVDRAVTKDIMPALEKPGVFPARLRSR